MASFVILLIARTAIHTDRHTHAHTHETTTVTLAAHARRGLIIIIITVLEKNIFVLFPLRKKAIYTVAQKYP